MNKIPTIFKRAPYSDLLLEGKSCSENLKSGMAPLKETWKLSRVQHPDCTWVFDGEGVATRKYDGTCCWIDKGILYKRREVKRGKPIPDGFIKISTDETTGKSVGWILVDHNDKNDRYHVEAFSLSSTFSHFPFADGTYELVGPKVQGNPEGYSENTLIKHASAVEYHDVPRTYDGLYEWLKRKDIEGLVFHHPSGKMAKIKKKDFKLARKD